MTMQPDPPPVPAVTPDPIIVPAGITPARLSLGRAGSGMPTRAVLDFATAHALARDAVHAVLDPAGLTQRLRAFGGEVLLVDSAAPDRQTYLRRPDFGRRLSRGSRTLLAARPRVPSDVVFVVADGLSARAVDDNAVPVIEALLPILSAAQVEVGPIVLACQARVALGDEVGALLATRLIVVLIGERPGLSAADSLGAYVTFGPKLGRTDAERNCLSNIRPAGLTPSQAALTLGWLIRQALTREITGFMLKDESGPVSPGLTGPEATRK